MQVFLDYLWYFVLFSFFGWVIEALRSMLLEKRFSNNGFLTSPFCTTYGLCATICYLTMKPFEQNKLILFFGSAAVMSLILVLIGFITHKLLKFKPWDFSSAPLNMGSYMTLPYALLLGIIGVMLVVAIIPVITTAIELIPFWLSLIIVLSLCACILIDFVFSVITTLRLLGKIKKLKNISELLEKGASEQEIANLEQNYNRLFTANILRKRLAHAFPGLTYMDYVKEIGDKIEGIKEDNKKEYVQEYENEEEKPFAFGFCFTKLFYLFVIGSILGTIFETVWALFAEGHFEVRVGMVYGPFIPVYGGGACFLTAVLYKLYKLSDTLIFVISAVVGAGFEYFCSWFQEAVFGTISWDYSNTPFNIDGRTNLMYALIWGFLGLVWVRYLYPWGSKLIEKMPKKSGSIITTFLIVFMAFNAFMSVSATYRWIERLDGVPASNSFAVYFDKHFDNDKMSFLFPNMINVDNTSVTTKDAISKNPANTEEVVASPSENMHIDK